MDVQVILTSDDPKLGRRGQVIKVSSGYAQNYLFPHRKAQPATPANLKQFEAEKARRAKEDAGKLSSARELSDKLRAASIKLEMAAGEGDKLFGAVTSQHVAEALAAKGLAVERRMIHLEEPIKKLGGHEIEFRLHPEVTVKVHIDVVRK